MTACRYVQTAVPISAPSLSRTTTAPAGQRAEVHPDGIADAVAARPASLRER